MSLPSNSDNVAQTASPEPAVVPVATAKKSTSALWWILGSAIAILALLLVAATAKQIFYRAGFDGQRQTNLGMMRSDDFQSRRMMRGGMTPNNQSTTSGTSRLSGVVTAIDGTKITIAGFGTTKTVETNDKTEYYGASQPVKVNDSVMMVGATSGDTFTASRITIQRQ